MAILKINGDIIPNDLAWAYDFFGEDYTCPSNVNKVIEALKPGEKLEVKINSPGGSVFAGQEIYTELLNLGDRVDIQVQSMAASAASIIACAGHSKISPVAMLMIHNASAQAEGDYHDMAKMSDTLRKVNEALASAYVRKTHMSKEEILELMDRETWLSANDCIKYGFCDDILDTDETPEILNTVGALKITPAMIAEARKQMANDEKVKDEILKDLDNFGI